MNEEKALDLIRTQGRLIVLLQTEIAENFGFLMVHGINPKPERCEDAKKLREQITTLKGELYT